MVETKKNPIFRVKIWEIQSGKSKTATLYGNKNDQTTLQSLFDKIKDLL